MYQPPSQYPPQYQQAYYPRRVVTRRPLSGGETVFHLLMTIGTGGLWGLVWWWRARSRRTVTTFMP